MIKEQASVDKKQVAAVCGREMLIFAAPEKQRSRRKLVSKVQFNTYGQALYAAREFDENETRKELVRQKRRGES